MILKKHIYSILICSFAAISLFFNSCSFFFDDQLGQEPLTAEINLNNNPREVTLQINPVFAFESTRNYSRNAYPEFTSTQLSGLEYTVTSEILTSEVTGNYDSSSGKIIYSIRVEPFSNKVFTFYVKNTSGKIICTAQKTLSCSSIGQVGSVAETISFTAYTGNGIDIPANGSISLIVSHATTGFSFENPKVYKNPGTSSEAEENSITCSITANTCSIISGTDGIAPGTYEFRTYVKNAAGIPFMYFKQKIEVWPGIATNNWYFNGSKSQIYTLTGNGSNVLYVRGTGGSLYGGSALPAALAASNDNAGTLLSPLASLGAAIEKCKNSSGEITIYIDGTIICKDSIGGTDFTPSKIIIEGITGNETDILDGNESGTVLSINKGEVLLKNLKITNGSATSTNNQEGGGINNNTGCTLKLENVWIDGNVAAKSGGGLYNNGTCFLYGSTIIGSKNPSNYAQSAEGKHSNIANNGAGIKNNGNLYIGYSGFNNAVVPEPVPDDSFSGGIYYNYAAYNGGGIHSEGGNIYFYKGNISFNATAQNGAGVYLIKKNNTYSYLWMNGGVIDNNKSNITGGAVYSETNCWINFSGSSYIPLDTNEYNDVYLASNAKIKVIETLSPPANTNGIVAYLKSAASVNSNIVSAESGVNLATESQRFKLLTFPKIIDTEGNLVYTTDYYVSSATSTPAGNDTSGNGSSEKPLLTVSKAVDLIKNSNITANYTIHIAGIIKDSIVLSTGTLGNTVSSSFTICGTDKDTDMLDGSDNSADKPLVYVDSINTFKFENLTICNSQSTVYAGLHNTYDGNTSVTNEITNCKIIGNLGGGVYSKAFLELKNCEITGNQGGDGAGLYLSSNGFAVDEKVTITGNTNSTTGAASNVYLANLNLITLHSNFSNNSRIGISIPDSSLDHKINETEYTGTEAQAQTIFLSDNNSRYISLESNNLYIKSVTYAKIGDEIYHDLATTKAAIQAASSGDENTVILYRPVTTDDFLEIIQAIKDGSGFVNIIVDENANIVLNADSSNLFAYCSYLKNVNLSGCDTSNITNMSGMFSDCAHLESFSFEGLDLHNVQNMDELFCRCRMINKISLKDCNISNVTSMAYMFYNCTEIHEIDMTGCNTSNVESMEHMFEECSSKLNYLDLSMFDTTQVSNMDNMFNNCAALINIIVGPHFSMAGVSLDTEMFLGCSNLKGGNGTLFSSTTANMARIDTASTPGYFTGQADLIMKTVIPDVNGIFNGGYNISGSNVFISERSFGKMRSLIASDHEITQGEYEKYCRYLNNSKSPTNAIGKGYYYPAYFVSWYDAVIYCNLRSMDEGLDCVYSVDGKTNPAEWADSQITNGLVCAPASPSWTVSIDGSKNGWRLPYEVEWEYLARGGDLSQTGTQTQFSGSDNVADVAWTTSTSAVNGAYMTHPVKSLAPNGCQMYDMSGNVWEWTSDFHSNKSSSPYTDQYTPISGSYEDSNGSRVTKSGGYRGGDNQSKLSNRMYSAMTERADDLGFRIVRNIDNYIGTKTPEQTKCVGDIVFSDNSSSSYLEFQNLNSSTQEEKKSYAIAVIFYSGTGLNNGSDTTTKRTLGVGLKHNRNGVQWCINGANAYHLSISNIITAPYKYQYESNPDYLRNGKRALQLIGEFLSAPENNTSDDTIGEGAKNRYPAFYYAINYKEKAQNIVGTIFENDWYLPTYPEMYEMYALRASLIHPINIDTISELCGGDKFIVSQNDIYVCSNQNKDYPESMYTIRFISGNPSFNNYPKGISDCFACAIHEF